MWNGRPRTGTCWELVLPHDSSLMYFCTQGPEQQRQLKEEEMQWFCPKSLRSHHLSLLPQPTPLGPPLNLPPWHLCISSFRCSVLVVSQKPLSHLWCLSPPPASPSCWCGWLFRCYWFSSIKDCSIHFLHLGPAPDLRVGPMMTELIMCTASPEGLQPHSLLIPRQDKTVKVNMIHKLCRAKQRAVDPDFLISIYTMPSTGPGTKSVLIMFVEIKWISFLSFTAFWAHKEDLHCFWLPTAVVRSPGRTLESPGET